MFNYSKLNGRIVEKYGCQVNLAIKLKMSNHTLSYKLNNKVDFRQNEIIKICDLLDIKYKDIDEYFFTINVQKCEQE